MESTVERAVRSAGEQHEKKLLYLAMAHNKDGKKSIPDYALFKDVLTKENMLFY